MEDSNSYVTPLKRSYVTPLKRVSSAHISPLEALPHDILLRVLRGVDHDDLEQLFYVSRTIREASLDVEELHFNFSTPTNHHIKVESPKTPFIVKQPREEESKFNLEDFTKKRKKINVKDISTVLFCATS
ncbi:F-box protein At1g61340-like [Trifolium pratense]|uniref:Uncharacterized protein n=1 Tax=Trifolium pratense TaxID=57577 RepID=A0ACB0JWR8_TRIPR|nr:F-box protein At1g61340-like [Trifolium pratense]CAJ2648741.1 unnamed protein product [Trifolium pratense]